MIVCICNELNEAELKKIIIEHNDVHNIRDLQKYADVCNCCQGCYSYIEKMIHQIDGGRTR